MSLSRVFIFALCLACAVLAPLRSFAAGNMDSPAVAFVQTLGDKALHSLTARDLAESDRAQRVRALLTEDFDLKTIGRFVLGTHWAEASEGQRDEYFKLFEDMIVRTYSSRFAEYSGQSFKVTGIAPPEAGSHDSLVNSEILQGNGGPAIKVDWRVRDEGGHMTIVDVVVDDVSMSVTQRSEFDAVIQRGGGKFDALLDSLRQGGTVGKH